MPAITSSTTAPVPSTNGSRCPGCDERDAVISKLRQRLAKLNRELQQQRERAGKHSGNSSLPPSANPPDAPKLAKKKRNRSGRKPGGQPGHPPAEQAWFPPEQLTEPPIACIPETCEHCQAALTGVDSLPLTHQVIELPPIQPEIRQYERHLLTCPHCGETTRGRLPDGVTECSFGPRLQAFVGLCTGCYHLSKRQTKELLTTALNVPIGLGTISEVEQRLSDALAAPVAEAHAHIQQADVLGADETSWKQQPNRAWVWVAVTAYLAVFLIRDCRDLASALALLGPDFEGILISDRYTSYNWVKQRQLCWAHLRRDWQAFIDRGGGSQRIGEELLRLTDDMFVAWWEVRDRTSNRHRFQSFMNPLRRQIGDLLRQGADCAHAKTAGTCRDILKHEESLWTFVDVEGVDPTNNAAERALRQAVLWRKKSFGTRSAKGSRYVERILTVVATCRLQRRNVLEFLTAACTARVMNLPAPSLLPDKVHNPNKRPLIQGQRALWAI